MKNIFLEFVVLRDHAFQIVQPYFQEIKFKPGGV